MKEKLQLQYKHTIFRDYHYLVFFKMLIKYLNITHFDNLRQSLTLRGLKKICFDIQSFQSAPFLLSAMLSFNEMRELSHSCVFHVQMSSPSTECLTCYFKLWSPRFPLIISSYASGIPICSVQILNNFQRNLACFSRHQHGLYIDSQYKNSHEVSDHEYYL